MLAFHDGRLIDEKITPCGQQCVVAPGARSLADAVLPAPAPRTGFAAAMSGAIHIEQRWPRLTSNGVYALALEPGGSVWVAASRAGSRAHVVLRMTEAGRRGAYVPDGFGFGRGELVLDGARGSVQGLSVLVRDEDGVRPVGYEPAELWPGLGGVGRCF